MGNFPLTGANVSSHAAQVATLLDRIGISSRFIGYGPRSFCEAHLNAKLSRDDGCTCLVIYLRCVFRPHGLAQAGFLRQWRAHLFRVACLLRLIRQDGRIVFIGQRAPSAFEKMLELAFFALMRLCCGSRVQAHSGTATPAGVVAGLGGRWPKPVPIHVAEELSFQQILRACPEGQRISPTHVRRALAAYTLGRDDRDALAAEISACVERAEQLSGDEFRCLIGRHLLTAEDLAPAAIRKCLAPLPSDPRQSQLTAHMKVAGRASRDVLDYLRPEGMDRPLSPVARELEAALTKSSDHPLNARLGGDAKNLTHLNMILMLAHRRHMTTLAAFRQPWCERSWASDVIDRSHLMSCRGKLGHLPPHLHLHGDASLSTGLSLNFWMSARAFQTAGIATRFVCQDKLDPFLPRGTRELSQPVALYHHNADQIPEVIFNRHRFDAPYHIGFLLWEFDQLPAAHRLALEMLDEIWVPSVFTQRLYQSAFQGKVRLMRKALMLPRGALPRLASQWQKAAGIKRYLLCFDAHSSVARKNPLAAVRAFQAAFPGRRDVELLIKSTPLPTGHWGDPEGQLATIQDIAGRDVRIRLQPARLPFPQLCALIASADALVSPHRAEGFGYFPSFALALGIPVISTDYSGPRDFCTEQTAFPVSYTLERVPRHHAIFPTPGARWAEIDHAHLTHRMREVDDFPETARRRAADGKALMKFEYSLDMQARRYTARLEELGFLQREMAGCHGPPVANSESC
ncbi:glycosyltransferase [Algicella marina]|uniref:Glycosyl transferase family 1 domain-containing protein n=1 Tax=Algicella marina TaxID=2683284 RepID=A0A6P1T1A8_9RHOB|nr:glycosyltransferase [Algicella marina]QHQ35600.1 hypothetical protein GO499_10620 [Algicella marina]